jgi:hypothetical protein
MDAADLYREEVFTDRKVGSIRQLSPVKSDGMVDARRRTLYIGQAQLLTQLGALPLSFEIDANSLEQAVAKFADAAKVAVDRTMKELQEMRREAASSIVIPERGGVGPGSGLPGSGKIQFP